MGKSLVIVESPSKATIINRYLGDDYVVRASVGHIRDLANGSSSKAETADGKKSSLLKKKLWSRTWELIQIIIGKLTMRSCLINKRL